LLMQQRAHDPALTLSAKVLEKTKSEGSWGFGYQLAQRYADSLDATPLPENIAAEYAEYAAQSRIRQTEIENSDTVSFAQYVQRWRTPVSTPEKSAQLG
jgi:glutamate--cysteine ligase